MNAADRIQLLRKQKGLSQEQLADEIGVSRQLVSKWENEQALPDMERVIILSEYFDTTADYILRGIEPAKPEVHEHSSLSEAQLRSILLDVFLWAVIIISGFVLLQLIFLALTVGHSASQIEVNGINKVVKPDFLASLKSYTKFPIWWFAWILFLGAGFTEIRRIMRRKKKVQTAAMTK